MILKDRRIYKNAVAVCWDCTASLNINKKKVTKSEKIHYTLYVLLSINIPIWIDIWTMIYETSYQETQWLVLVTQRVSGTAH